MVYVTSDWHGVPLDDIKRLLKKGGFTSEDFLFVLGDVIDRGEHGVELLKWLMVQPNMKLILGNHEELMLNCKFWFSEITQRSIYMVDESKMQRLYIWRTNGGDPTIEGLEAETPKTRADIIEFLEACPVYDTVHVGGRDFVLVHGGLDNYAEGKRLSEYTRQELLWARNYYGEEYSHQFMTVFGHTPTHFAAGREYKGRIYKTPTYINIDTGAACGCAPCLLCLDTMEEFYIYDANA